MFTGIIEEIGTVKSIKSTSNNMILEINAPIVTSDIKLGDSVAVNGTCLTVTSFNNSSFCVDIMPETYNTTSLKTCKASSLVNLERSLRADSRVGGHFVSGHVDGIGTIIARKPNENAIYFDIQVSHPELLQYAIYHGSIAIDGTSLTIFGLSDNFFTISLIPHTIKHSIIGYKQVGEIVNIEYDMFAKLISRAVNYQQQYTNNTNTKIDQDFLKRYGFN
ncbi:MAG: riboflavin synthase [Neisseriaceae bacterium]|jgi:riboflavin synthase